LFAKQLSLIRRPDVLTYLEKARLEFSRSRPLRPMPEFSRPTGGPHCRVIEPVPHIGEFS
jgi:hypothetical protein